MTKITAALGVFMADAKAAARGTPKTYAKAVEESDEVLNLGMGIGFLSLDWDDPLE